MISASYREEENWMHQLMNTYWSGVEWTKAVADHEAWSRLLRPHLHGPGSIGKILTKELCTLCGEGKLGGFFASRKEKHEGLTWAQSTACVRCGHKPYSNSCSCDICRTSRQNARKKETELKREREIEEKVAIDHIIRERIATVNANCSNLEDLVGYDQWAIALAMLEQSTSENLWYITSLNSSPNPFAPSQEMARKSIQKIIDYIKFANDRPPSAKINEEGLNWNGLTENYLFHGNLVNPKKFLLDNLTACSKNCADAECIALDIGNLMLEEALSFLECTRNEYHLPHNVGEKTISTLTKLILERPLGQVFYLIWKTCNDSAASVQKKTYSASHASNLV